MSESSQTIKAASYLIKKDNRLCYVIRSGLKNLFFGLTMNGGKNKVITIKCTCIP